MNSVSVAWILMVIAGLWTLCGVASLAGAGVLLRSNTLALRLDLLARIALAAGVACLAALLAALWITLDRPPMRTLGETRLWYALLLPSIGLLIEWRLKTRVLRLPMVVFALLFIGINIARPETLDRTLMPALQSVWFVPHVVVYMIAYAALGLGCGAAVWTLIHRWWRARPVTDADLHTPMLLVHLAVPFLTLGICFGAIWAKQAWGHYWTWDPKETWALLSWGAYVAIIHLERHRGSSPRRLLLLNIFAFIVLLGCWFLLNHLPAARTSVHAYT